MPLEKIDHYAIRTQRMDETKDFYEALGLHAGARPEFPFPGHWMYAGDTPVVHIVGIDPDNPDGLYNYLGLKDLEFLDGSGAVDHLAFRASDPEGLKIILKDRNVKYREREVPNLGLLQIFVEDPNDITVEINYYNQ
ncbi:MAG: VOC family protein [Rhodospirillales bacterium]|jgi:catechol 2,3-dioxygenase-like lactoylglutathione lyase family enzyme